MRKPTNNAYGSDDAFYVPFKKGWDAIALSPDILDACVDTAARGLPFAVAISPHGTEIDLDDSDKYVNHFKVIPTTTVYDEEWPTPRVAAELSNDAFHSALVEWGRKGAKAYHVIGQTAAWLGATG